MSKLKTLLYYLLGLNFLLKFIIAIRPLKYIDNITIQDDSYLALTIARNIAKGLGPLYGTNFTNGFQPLYVFLMAPIYAIFPNDLITPVHLALIMLTIFDTLTLYMLYKLVSLKSQSPIAPFIIMTAWIFNTYVILMTLNGLETAIAMFFIAICYYYYQTNCRQLHEGNSVGPFVILGVLLGLAMLARIDNAILAMVIGIAIIIGNFKAGKSKTAIIRNMLILFASALVVYSPWMIYSYHYTGSIFPVSGRAVRLIALAEVNNNPTLTNWYFPQFLRAFMHTAARNPIYIVMLLGLIAALPRYTGISFREIKARLEQHNVYLSFCILLFGSYAFYIFGSWFFSRYLYPIMLLFILYLSEVIDCYIINIRSIRIKRLFVPTFIIFLIVVAPARPSFRNYFFKKDTTHWGYMNLGLWARDNFPEGTIIGAPQTGALGYFANNLTVINLDGVVNRKAYEANRRRENIEYIRQCGIKYVIDWKAEWDLIKVESRNLRPDDLILVKKIEGFQSWGYEWYLYKVNDKEGNPKR
jgi:hypothetical protein